VYCNLIIIYNVTIHKYVTIESELVFWIIHISIWLVIIRARNILQFHGKTSLSTSYVSNWIGQHCPRLVYGLQRYVVHVLTTAYRNGKALLSKEQPQPSVDILTPVLEKSDQEFPQVDLLPISYVWLLSCTLPQSYLQVRCRRLRNINRYYYVLPVKYFA